MDFLPQRQTIGHTADLTSDIMAALRESRRIMVRDAQVDKMPFTPPVMFKPRVVMCSLYTHHVLMKSGAHQIDYATNTFAGVPLAIWGDRTDDGLWFHIL